MQSNLTLTIESKIDCNSNLSSQLDKYASFYTHLERKLFNDLVNSEKIESELRKQLKRKYIAEHKIHARFFNALWIEVKGKIDSLKELQRTNMKTLKKRLQRMEKSILKDCEKPVSKNSKLLKRGYRKSKQQHLKPHEIKQLKHTLYLQNQKRQRLLDNINKPSNLSMVFGSKSFYKKQWTDDKYKSNRKNWLHEWRRKRNCHFTFVGSKDETNGNQMCQYFCNDDGEFIRITLPYFYKDKFLTISVKFHSDRKNKQYYNYFHEAVQQGVALSYRFIKRENGNWYVLVSFSIPKEVKTSYNGIIGVDVNCGLFTTAEIDRYFNYTKFKNYEFDSDGKASDQIKDIIGNIVKDIVQRAKESDKSISIEDLDLQNKKMDDSGKYVNRKINMIEYSIFKQLMISKCLKEGVRLKIVNPAFTSIIGKYKYSKRYGVSVHIASAIVIARRFKYKIKEKVPVQMACVLQRGEADRWLAIYRHKHHWSHWKFLHKNLVKCLKQFNPADGNAVSMNTLTARFNPNRLSFLIGSDSPILKDCEKPEMAIGRFV